LDLRLVSRAPATDKRDSHPGWSASPNVAQILWGALFCVPSGFSFTALRISTWVASVLGVIGVYRLLRVGGVSVRDTLLGACLLEACPVFLILSFTFMTDILWLTPAIWFAYALVKAVQARSNAWLITATIFGCIAGAVRVTGAALPLVAMAVLWFHASGLGRRVMRLAIPAAGFAAAGGVFSHVCKLYRAPCRPPVDSQLPGQQNPKSPQMGFCCCTSCFLETRRYQISNRPVSQWTILKQEPYRRWLSHSGSIYILVNPRIQ